MVNPMPPPTKKKINRATMPAQVLDARPITKAIPSMPKLQSMSVENATALCSGLVVGKCVNRPTTKLNVAPRTIPNVHHHTRGDHERPDTKQSRRAKPVKTIQAKPAIPNNMTRTIIGFHLFSSICAASVQTLVRQFL
jgi:hypothetical protein